MVTLTKLTAFTSKSLMSHICAGALDVQMNRISQMYDHEGRAARIERYAIATAGTGIRGTSTVNTHPVPGTFRP